jgi:predicted ATPase
MISRIGASSYRCFSRLDVEVPAYAVLAGANGIGKSTLLDIPVLLGDLSAFGVQKALLQPMRKQPFPRAQSYREIFHRGQGTRCQLLVEAALPTRIREQHLAIASADVQRNPPTHLRYQVGLLLSSSGQLGVEHETLDLFPQSTRETELARPSNPKSRGWRPIIERLQGAPAQVRAEFRRGHQSLNALSPDQLALSTLSDELLYPAATWLATLLQRESLAFQPDCTQLRSAVPPAKMESLQADASDLPWRIQHLNEEQRREWCHVVQLALPAVLDIRVREREDDHHAYLQLDYRYGDSSARDHSVPSSGLSDGTLRIMAFTLLPYLPDLPGLLLIEQPEDGIHPRAIDLILQSLAALSVQAGQQQTQTLVTTHSPVVVARTPLANLICLRRDDQGAVEAINGPNHPRLVEWQRDAAAIDLGTLFSAGVLS